MQIIPLMEGAFSVGPDKVFLPFNLDTDVLNDRIIGSIVVEVQPFLIKTEKDLMIVDTGLGFNLLNGKLQIHDNLAKLGIDPGQITKVLLSHLHKDHAGGISYINKYDERVLTFENAKYYVNKNEYEYALQNLTASYLQDEFDFLHETENVIFTEGDGKIDDYISYFHSGGHCPWHQVFLIEENGEKIFYGGDEASQMRQMKIRYIAKYDYDGKLSADLRAKYAEQGKAEDWTFLFYHDVQNATAKLQLSFI